MTPKFATVLIAILLLGARAAPAWTQEAQAGVLKHEADALHGYTLLAPRRDNHAYLIDNQGRVVQQWDFGALTREIHLLDSGNVVVVKQPSVELDNSLITFSYSGDGVVAEYTWSGDLLGEYAFLDPKRRHHHGIDIMPNGNILAIVWDYHRMTEALANGLRTAIAASIFNDLDAIMPDTIVEIDLSRGEVVWEWHSWDHLVQDFDPILPNYGSPSARPDRLDINYHQYAARGIPATWSAGPADWHHSNMVAYNPALDQIVISVLRFDEFWIINHGLTVEEAAGPRGDLLYRWGNPFAYGGGHKVDDRQLFQQHDVQWIDQGLPGAGNILLFNNRNNVLREDEQSDDEYSSILEVKLPLLDDGSYDWTADAEIVWQYDRDFYSRFVSGVQRLPNGNTLITEGAPGRLIEVTADGRVVWEFVNPTPTENGALFRVRKYPADHPGLAGKDLTPGRLLGE